MVKKGGPTNSYSSVSSQASSGWHSMGGVSSKEDTTVFALEASSGVCRHSPVVHGYDLGIYLIRSQAGQLVKVLFGILRCHGSGLEAGLGSDIIHHDNALLSFVLQSKTSSDVLVCHIDNSMNHSL